MTLALSAADIGHLAVAAGPLMIVDRYLPPAGSSDPR
jgi:hypothetical protein